jgi:hypothetical protein
MDGWMDGSSSIAFDSAVPQTNYTKHPHHLFINNEWVMFDSIGCCCLKDDGTISEISMVDFTV